MITERSKRIVREEKVKLLNTVKYFQSVTTNRLVKSHHDIRSAGRALIQESKFLMTSKRREIEQAKAELEKKASGHINSHRQILQSLDKTVNILDPINILKRGFSITLHHGKALKSYADVRTDDPITTVLADGQIVSNVKSIQKTE
jgi:exodeoxyribonuclease VII large subunit